MLPQVAEDAEVTKPMTAVFGGRMNQELEQAGEKKSYEPPQLVTISLRPEEAVLGHCKIAGSGGPVTSSCAALNCLSLGS
jgi:hypothetical protein